jgi:hypothetical protein
LGRFPETKLACDTVGPSIERRSSKDAVFRVDLHFSTSSAKYCGFQRKQWRDLRRARKKRLTDQHQPKPGRKLTDRKTAVARIGKTVQDLMAALAPTLGPRRAEEGQVGEGYRSQGRAAHGARWKQEGDCAGTATTPARVSRNPCPRRDGRRRTPSGTSSRAASARRRASQPIPSSGERGSAHRA